MSGERDPGITVRRIEDPRQVARKMMGKGAATQDQPHQPVNMPNTLRSRATARVMDVISEGPILGLHDGVRGGPIWHSVLLDDTPIQDEAGNFNFGIREGYLRYGLPGQDPVPGWPASEASFGVGVEAKYLVPVVRSLNTPISAVRYVIRLAALVHLESDGDVTDHSVAYAFDYRIDGGAWINAVTEAISGKTMSPFERQVRVQLPFTTGTCQVRMTRLTPDDEGSEFQNRTFFASYTEIIDGQLSYDDTALVSLTVDAEEFQALPKRSFLVDGVCVAIPSNYDPFTHGYVGDWNGTFVTQWTQNPAWLLYAFLTNKRWGLGNHIDVNAIDKWSFNEAGVYCDGIVPNGFGGAEVRFTCNAVLNTRQDAYTVLQALASSMLCQLYYANGTIFLVQDKRITHAERIFGPADVVDGLFEYQSADYRTRINAVAVSWNDPEDNYETQVELVQDPQLVAQQGYRDSPTTAYGCTSRGQAQRLGRWLIYTNQYETEIVSFRVGLENADVRPGMLINVSDPALVGARLAGRLLDNDTAQHLTLDKLPQEMVDNPGFGWYIIVTVGSAAEPDFKPRLYELPVYSFDVSTSDITLGNAKPEPFPAGSMWMLRSTHVEPRPFRVNAISDLGQAVYQITATEYHIEKFDYVEYGLKFPPPPMSLIPTGPLLPPSDLKYTEYIYLDARGAPQFGVLLTWTPSTDARVMRYQIEMSGPGGDYRKFIQVTGVLQDVQPMRQGQWLVTLIAYDNVGRRSKPISIQFVPIGLSEKPLPPGALYITANGRTSTLIWTPTGEIDVVAYWIKWTPVQDGASWARATTSIARVDRDTTQIVTPTRSGTFMIKAIDSLGQESESWAEAILVEQITDDVHVEDIREQVGSSGLALSFMGGSLPAGVTLARASTGWYFDSSGTLQSAATNVARFPYQGGSPRGVFNEPAATNVLRNSSASGAVVGSPGTLPSTWNAPTGTVIPTVVARPVVNGIQCVDVRFIGTASAGSAYLMLFESGYQPFPANTPGTGSVYLALVAGSLANVNNIASLITYNPAGSPQTGDIRALLTPNLQRFTVTGTSPAGTTGVINRVVVTWTNGAAIDFTMRFGLPQMETGAIATSPIVTLGSAAVTRAAEVLTVAVPPSLERLAYTREDGSTATVDVGEVASYVVPTSLSPVQSVTVDDPAWGGTLGPYWHRNLGQLLLPPPIAPEPVPPDVITGDRATALNQVPTRVAVYGFEADFDLGLVSSVSMVAIVEGYALYLGRVMAQWLPLASADPLASGISGAMATWQPLAMAVPLALGSADSPAWDARLDVRISQDGATFGEWTPLKSALITGRRFQWRLVGAIYDLATTARIVRAEVWMDIPLRNIGDDDVALDTTGHLTVTYATPFLVPPTVQLTARQSLAPGGNIVITASTADHFTVEHRNAAGTAVTGLPNASLDYFVQGYGGGIPLALAG